MMGLHYDKFILFGDSITQLSYGKEFDFSFSSALQGDYIRKLDVLNRGYGGYNSTHGTIILPEILNSELGGESKIKLLTIFFGTNDAVNTSQHVALGQYRENLTKMVQLALDNDIKPILIGPALHDPKSFKEFMVRRGEPLENDITSNRQNKLYSDAAKSVAASLKIPFIDLWINFRDHGKWTEAQLLNEHVPLGELLSDGMHFTSTGYRILYDKIVEVIEKWYPELKSKSLKEKLINWEKIDERDLKGSIFKDD